MEMRFDLIFFILWCVPIIATGSISVTDYDNSSRDVDAGDGNTINRFNENIDTLNKEGYAGRDIVQRIGSKDISNGTAAPIPIPNFIKRVSKVTNTVDGVEWTFKSPGICQLSHFEDPLRDPISANANSLRECMKLCKHNCKYVSYAIPNCYIADNCDLMHSSSSYKTFGKNGCCIRLDMTSTGPALDHQSRTLGIYTNAEFSNGAISYKNDQSDVSLHYTPINYYWMLSPETDVGTNIGYIHSTGCSQYCPNDCTTWKVWNGDAWVFDRNLTIQCVGVTSFDGWCRYGSDAREFIGSVTSNEVSKCKEQCSSTNGCTAFAYTIEASNNCNLYRNGPYTYGNGKEKTTCYIMHSATPLPTTKPSTTSVTKTTTASTTTKKIECDPKCENHGICAADHNEREQCFCASGYTGAYCELGPCDFGIGDAVGATETYLGHAETAVKCVEMVQTQKPTANGVTYGTASGSFSKECYAEFGATHTNNNTDWQTCLIERSQDSEICCMEKGVHDDCLVLCKDENANDTKTRSTFESKCEKHLISIRSCTHPPVYNYTSTKMKGRCGFQNCSHDYFNYDYDYTYDTENEAKCLQWCEEKALLIDHAVGCYYAKDVSYDYVNAQCMFLKSGTIVQEKDSNPVDEDVKDVCWKFDLAVSPNPLKTTLQPTTVTTPTTTNAQNTTLLPTTDHTTPEPTIGRSYETPQSAQTSMEHLIFIIVATNIIVVLAAVSVGVFICHRIKKSNSDVRKNEKLTTSTVLEMSKITTKMSITKFILGNLEDSTATEFEKLNENERLTRHQPTLKATLQKNSRFNVDPNVIPYDSNRVELSDLLNQGDYVNASWIHTLKEEGEYDNLVFHRYLPRSLIGVIVGQAPNETTISHHWRMLYEKDIDLEISITGKNAKSVYQQDYASCPVTRTVVEVKQVESFLTKEHWDMTTERGKTSRLSHFRFQSQQPDGHLTLDDIDNLLKTISYVRRQIGIKRDSINIAVSDEHGGVSAAAVFIALLYALEDLDDKTSQPDAGIEGPLNVSKETATLDVFEIVNELRKKRMKMVCRHDDYLLIFKAVQRYAQNCRMFQSILEMKNSETNAGMNGAYLPMVPGQHGYVLEDSSVEGSMDGVKVYDSMEFEPSDSTKLSPYASKDPDYLTL